MPSPSVPTPSQADTSAIDVVYLWVDGNDPTWRNKRQRAANRLLNGSEHALARHGNVEGRFRDNDELRYSLRALERYFPAHGHIYLLTDGQTPDWLRADDRLTVVSHQDLLPAKHRPTFDSGNIETYLHHIPGLSERYFYCNDDVFFGAPVAPEQWFYPGGIYTTWSDDPAVHKPELQANDHSLENASRLSQQWLDAHPEGVLPGYLHTPRTFAHAPRPMLKSLLQRLEAQAPELFERARSTVFRAWDSPTLVSDFVLRWALAHGLARVRPYRHRYLASGDADLAAQLRDLEAAGGRLDFFCINDTTDNAHDHDPRLAQVKDSLEAMFGQPSRFERPPARPPHRPQAQTQPLAQSFGHTGAQSRDLSPG